MKPATIRICFAILAGTVTGALAQDDAWTFKVTPYIWTASIEGEATVRGQHIDFEKNASDLIDATDVVGSVRLGASYDSFAIGALLDYVSVSTDDGVHYPE